MDAAIVRARIQDLRLELEYLRARGEQQFLDSLASDEGAADVFDAFYAFAETIAGCLSAVGHAGLGAELTTSMRAWCGALTTFVNTRAGDGGVDLHHATERLNAVLGLVDQWAATLPDAEEGRSI